MTTAPCRLLPCDGLFSMPYGLSAGGRCLRPSGAARLQKEAQGSIVSDRIVRPRQKPLLISGSGRRQSPVAGSAAGFFFLPAQSIRVRFAIQRSAARGLRPQNASQRFFGPWNRLFPTDAWGCAQHPIGDRHGTAELAVSHGFCLASGTVPAVCFFVAGKPSIRYNETMLHRKHHDHPEYGRGLREGTGARLQRNAPKGPGKAAAPWKKFTISGTTPRRCAKA